jgi:hypothetical protein
VGDFPRDWFPVSDAEAFAAELRAECGDGHPLHGVQVEAFAQREGRDDVAFRLLGTDEIAQVHLTWKGTREESPNWPTTTLFESAAAWRSAVTTFTFGEKVMVSSIAPSEFRPGSTAWVVALPIPGHDLVTIEFADGSSVDVPPSLVANSD